MFMFATGSKRQNFRGLTRLQQPNRKSRAGWFMCVCVCVCVCSCFQAVAASGTMCPAGRAPWLERSWPCPAPPPSCTCLEKMVSFLFFFFFSKREFRSFRSIRDRERYRQKRVQRRWRAKGWVTMMKMRVHRWAAPRKEMAAEVMAAKHSWPSRSADLQPQLLASVLNHLELLHPSASL